MATAQPLNPARDEDDLATKLEAAVEQVAHGWPAEKRAALWVELRRRLAKESPGALAQALDPNTLQTPALRVIDHALVDVEEGRCRRLLISMPPQEGKSTRVARYGALWALLRNPDRRVAIASYADTLAGEHSAFVRDLVQNHGVDATREGGTDMLGLRLSPSSSARHRWDLHGHRGGCVGVGIGSGLTGKPVDWMVIDDPHKDREDADSILRRERVWSWYTDVVLARGPKVIVAIFTRWHEDDLGGRLLADDRALPEHLRQWRVINIAAQCEDPDTDPLDRRAGEFMLSARDGSDGTEVHDDAYFEERKRNARTWAALYQGHPTPLEGGMFKWDWIRPYRVGTDDVPTLDRVVVAVDTTGGGNDQAGILAAGRGPDGRVYMLADRSGHYTAGGQWRTAWFTVIDREADVLVYERNLVDPIMRKAISSSWRRMVDQAQALQAAGALDPTLDPEDVDARVAAAAGTLARSGDDDVMASDDPLAALSGQLREVLPYAHRILEAPRNGPARVEGVSATRGKKTRAEPMSQAYETGQVSHVGVLPGFEQELVTWQEGQASPNRLDAGVWAWTFLQGSGPVRMVSPRQAAPGVRVATGPRARTGPRYARGR